MDDTEIGAITEYVMVFNVPAEMAAHPKARKQVKCAVRKLEDARKQVTGWAERGYVLASIYKTVLYQEALTEAELAVIDAPPEMQAAVLQARKS